LPVSITELREKGRLLEAELARIAAVSDSLDTRAGVAIGFAGVLAGLLVQAKSPGAMLRAAAIVALAAAVVGVGAAWPYRLEAPDPQAVARAYDSLAEYDATAIVTQATLRAITFNTGITELKRLLLTLTVVGLVAAIVLAAIGVW
jgi:hypothetical protein